MAELSKTQAKKRQRTYTRAGIVPLDVVLPLIRNPEVKSVVLLGHKVKVTSLRLQTFAKSCTCSACGLVATHFAVETNSDWHLNLWADRGPGKTEMLFTHDHTVARSLGGADNESNVTTMCAKCNHSKGREEYIEFCKLHDLPAPGSSIKRKGEKQQSTAATSASRREENKRVHTYPMEYAVRKFRKFQLKAEAS